MDIVTERLVLRLVPLTGLAATAAGDRDACRRIIGPRLPEAWFDEAWVAEMRLKQWTDNPAYAPWSIRAVALRQTGEIVGNINCHAEPEGRNVEGETIVTIELGYTIFAPWRRQGYAAEAATGFCNWAAATAGVEGLILSISPENVPSLALARRLGTRRIGMQIDEIDGPEDIYFTRIAAPAEMNGT